MTINNKSERNDRGKCLGWPVTSYGAAGRLIVFIFVGPSPFFRLLSNAFSDFGSVGRKKKKKNAKNWKIVWS